MRVSNCFTPLSGAIGLAAKSAGIIPGSPFRELDSPPVESSTLLDATPIVDAEPDSQLLQHNVPEVSSARNIMYSFFKWLENVHANSPATCSTCSLHRMVCHHRLLKWPSVETRFSLHPASPLS